MKEIWKSVVGYEGRYEVSNEGRVKRLYREVMGKNGYLYIIEEQLLVLSRDKDGYLVCKLRNKDLRKQLRVHRIVAEAFILNPENYPEVNHKNERIDDNRVVNLEWCSPLYNTHYGTGIYRRSLKARKRIYQCDSEGNIINVWSSVSDASKQLRINKGNISSCLTGRLKSTGGCYFAYVPPPLYPWNNMICDVPRVGVQI